MFKKNDHGDMGIGAMIVFIAMVLVAGIAASVLVQTANKLEIQAMQTGQQTTEEVATGLSVSDITGQLGTNASNGSWAPNSILNLTICVAPRSGSMDIDLSNTVVELSNSNTKYILTYDQALYFAAPDPTGVFVQGAFATLNSKSFGLIVLEDADGSCLAASPVINRGDHVLLTISAGQCFQGLQPRTDIWGMVIPETGAPGVFAFRTPASYPDVIYDLY